MDALEAARPRSAAAQRATQEFPGGAGAPRTFADRFELADLRWLQHLSDEGYVVLAGALGAAEVATALDHLWDFLPAATGWQRHDSVTWHRHGFAGVGLPHWGILKARGAGNCDAVWFCCSHPRVREAFERIWSTPELISSFDGFNVFLPWHHCRMDCKTEQGWMHSDQGPGKEGLQSIQGFVALRRMRARVASPAHPRLAPPHRVGDESPLSSGPRFLHGAALPRSAPLERQQKRLVPCLAGDLVLWDSRTVHRNAPAQTQPLTGPDELLRVAIYTCLVPRAWATPEELQLRREAYDNGYSCNHWPIFREADMVHFRQTGRFAVTPFGQSADGREDLI